MQKTADNLAEKAVLITGSSSGIGRACVLLLVKRGFQVFAGVRKVADGDALQAAAGVGVTPVVMDVTDAASIAAAAREVTSQLDKRGLSGLVNVAGIGLTGPLEYVALDDLRKIFEVNVFGQFAVIQAFMPLIRKGCGRIVNMGSVGAHIAIPFGGPLAASKSAFGSLNDSLRLELQPFGIRVCVIEPASIHTPAVDKTLGDVEGLIGRLPSEAARRYGQMLRTFTSRARARELNGSPPELVAGTVLRALTARRPHTRYPVGKDSLPLTILPWLLPDRLLDGLRARLFGLPATVQSQ
ncbi:MAG: SDR family oxidoreductase [Methylobacteriaceae bacterium]|nr:SDR family oxidoreductase [Methylobacteriaceae bacterium]MBV9246033.1 SDR family oxidoreductase [Methylobacteriaceae bacterium]MBV9635552.1 SDR family oxidoreductase [Methylobacteriaceae bacterium]MBV9703568.1 SDR family oxidoreductase [Methylobacteriaceae bacterium]